MNVRRSRFYRCPICGNIIEIVSGKGPIPFCCEREMIPLEFNLLPELSKKHLPIIFEKDNKVLVRIGELPHPMNEDHYIEWVYLHTDQGIERKRLHPNDKPEVIFAINDNEIVFDVFIYCNLHGLWKTSA